MLMCEGSDDRVGGLIVKRSMPCTLEGLPGNDHHDTVRTAPPLVAGRVTDCFRDVARCVEQLERQWDVSRHPAVGESVRDLLVLDDVNRGAASGGNSDSVMSGEHCPAIEGSDRCEHDGSVGTEVAIGDGCDVVEHGHALTSARSLAGSSESVASPVSHR